MKFEESNNYSKKEKSLHEVMNAQNVAAGILSQCFMICCMH
jgi:hypothetical protein